MSASKVMAMVFWDNQGVILTNYLPKGSTVTGEYYATELRQLKGTLKTQEARQAVKRSASVTRQCSRAHCMHCNVCCN